MDNASFSKIPSAGDLATDFPCSAGNKSLLARQNSLFGCVGNLGHCQSKFVYVAKTSEPDFAAIDFLAFFRVDLSGSMAAPSI
jgi:hypothetical protein